MKNSNHVRKLMMTAMLTCMSFVLSVTVHFPNMAPFQHFANVIAAAIVGPWYGCAAAFLCGIMRMMTGRPISAITGAIFGPVLGGLIYKKTGKLWLCYLGEIIGTGIVGAFVSFPLMKAFYGLDAQTPLYLVFFYTPSALVGGAMGVAVLLMLRSSGLLERMRRML